MQNLLIKNGNPKLVPKPATLILVPRSDGRALKFKNFESTGKFKMELTSHSELGLKMGHVVEGEQHSHDQEAFLQLCGAHEADSAQFTDGDIKVNGFALTVVAGAAKGRLVVLTSHEGAHKF